jgi:hypothetical protein
VRHTKSFIQLCAFMAVVLGGLIFYSQIWAFSWDEGFHLLAAQLIDAGKRPWLDFCFPQTPLNAYWNAGWMRALGQSWRVTHTVAACLTGGAALLTADYIFTRFPVTRWRLAGAITASLLIAWNVQVVDFATTAQAYGLCLFLIVAAFRVSVAAVDREGAALSAAAGLLACAAAASSLLTAAVAPVLLIWMRFHNRSGNRRIKLAAFVLAGAVPFLPVFWLFAQGPRRALFNLIQYQTLFRSVNWGHPWRQDFTVLISWIDSSQALTLGLLAVGGLLFIAKCTSWDRAVRAEFLLCGWLALAIGVELFTAHPTFQRYFLLIVPFLAVPAVAGLYAASSVVDDSVRPLWPALALGLLTFFSLARATWQDLDSFTWPELEQVAAKTDQVAPRGAPIWADELVYFLTRRPPPPGMEFAYAHKIEMPEAEAAELRILPNSVLMRQLAAGAFSAVETCDDDEKIAPLGLPRLYAKEAKVEECAVFWDKVSNQK